MHTVAEIKIADKIIEIFFDIIEGEVEIINCSKY